MAQSETSDMRVSAGPLSIAQLLSYGVGQTGSQILRDVPSALLLFYMTNARLIPPSLAGLAILIPKMWVILADPLIGMISDRTRGRWGARKPFLLAGSLVSGVAFYVLFSCPTPADPRLAALVVGILYFCLTTGFSLFSVPYLALAVDLSPEPLQRTRALGAKQSFSLVGVLCGLALAPWLVSRYGGGPAAYAVVATVLGAIVIVSMLLTTLLTPVRAASPSGELTAGSLVARFGSAFRHRPFRIVMLASTLQLFGFGTGGASAVYYVIYVAHLPLSVFSLYIVAAVVGAGIAQPLWVALAKRVGVLNGYRTSLLAHAFTTSLFLFLPAGSPVMFDVLGGILGTTTMGSTLMSFAMLVEVIALDGENSERKALFASIYTAMEKLTIAIGASVVAAILAIAGFSGSRAVGQQPGSVVHGVLAAWVGAPVLTLLLAVLVLSAYRQRVARSAAPVGLPG